MTRQQARRRTGRHFFHATILSIALATALYAALLPSRTPTGAGVFAQVPAEVSFAAAYLSQTTPQAFHLVMSTHPAPTAQIQSRLEVNSPADDGAPNLRITAAGATPQPQNEGTQATPTPSPTPSPSCETSHSPIYCVYTVEAGDTLSSIASKFDLKGTDGVAPWQLVVQSNKPEITSEEDLLQVGQKVRVPAGNGIVHTVLSAQTLSDIADQYDVSSNDITAVAANALANANSLRIGQELLVPGPQRLSKPALLAPRPSSAQPPSSGSPGFGAASSQQDQARGVSSSGFVWPASGPLSSRFGGSHPLGIDIDLYATPNAPNVAAAAGTVTFAGGNPCCSYGYYVTIDHGNGFETLYGHFSSLSVSVGQKVIQGQVLGIAGRTGYATGNHLHFEVRLDGSIVNPMSYLP